MPIPVRAGILARLLALVFFVWVGPAAAAETVRFADADGAVSLAGRLDYLRDPTGQLGIGDIAFGNVAAGFVTPPGLFNLGYTADAVWLRFTIERRQPAGRELYLQFLPNFLTHVDVFEPLVDRPATTADFRHLVLDAAGRTDQRPYVTIERVLAIEPPDGAARTYYARVVSLGSLPLRVDLRSSADRAWHAALTMSFSAAYQGLTLVVVLVNIVFFVVAQARVYLFYAGYVACLAALNFAAGGFIRIFLPQLDAGEIQLALTVPVALQTVMAALFVRDLLEVPARYHRVDGIMRVIAVLGVVATMLTVAGWFQQIAVLQAVVQLILTLTTFLVSLDLIRRRAPQAIPLFIGLSPLFVGVTFALLRALGLVPQSELADYTFQVTTLAHVVLMNIVLGGRLKLSQSMEMAAARQSEQRARSLAAERTADLDAARRDAEAALAAEREAQTEQVRLIDLIAHQYRTPLAIIANTAQSLRLSLSSGDHGNAERVERIIRAVRRLADTLDVALHPDRVEPHEARPDRRRVQLQPLIATTVQRARDGHPTREIRLVLPPDAETLAIDADPQLIDIALTNLVDNAMKFSNGTPVSITVAASQGRVALNVSDRGIGIPEDELHEVFRKFFRAANASDRPGMGIGLRLARQIVQNHGGDISLRSRVGVGTTVTIDLPLSPAD
ncbi:MAG: sensor histidine kinase [Alphaproteobacteria bacterium]|jgi:signal transduction histidine kinase|nr:sensor histidine kinase [Alphaproteobacteria bacterium]